MKYLIALSLVFALSTTAFAQKADSSARKKGLNERIVLGGNIGFQLGSVTYIDISPIVGYRITDKWQAGLGLSYIYASFRQQTQAGTIKDRISLYGGRVYTQYDIFKNIFLHGETELMNVPYYDRTTFEDERRWIVNPLVGGGLRTNLGGRATLNLTVLYNLNYARNSQIFDFYGSPIVIRGGVTL